MTLTEAKSGNAWIADERVLVEVSSVAINQKDMIQKLDTIKEPLRKFILIIIDLANKNGPTDLGFHFVGRTQIQAQLKKRDLGCSDALVSRRLATLCEHQVCAKQIQVQGIEDKEGKTINHRRNHYKIESFGALANIIPEKKTAPKKKGRQTKSVIHAQKALLSKSGGVVLENSDDMIYFHERLYNGILDVAMRLSAQDKRDTIEVNYVVAGQPLKITSVCSSKKGSAILMMTDQRLIRVLISYCKRKIEYFRKKYSAEHGPNFNPRLIPNLFHVDVHELCDLLSMNRVNSNLDIILGMMNRLVDTKFEVDASENTWFQEQFSAGFREAVNDDGSVDKVGSDQFIIQFLTNFEIATTKNDSLADIFGVDMSKLRPRYYTFSLDNRLFQSFLKASKEHLFLSHEEMAIENSGIVQRFYNWAGYHVSRRTRTTVENKWYSIFDMYEYLAPGHRMDNFKRQWMRALEKYAVTDNDEKQWKTGEAGKSLIHGYYVYYKRENGLDQFRFERDRNDHIVGDNSIHNRKNREAQQSLLLELELDESTGSWGSQ